MMYLQRFTLALLFFINAPLYADNPYSRVESLLVKEACIELGTRYAHYLDSNQVDKISTLFDEQGSWQGVTGRYTGREDIALAFSKRPKNRRTIHIVSNHLVEIQSKNLASVISTFSIYRTDQATGVTSIKDQPIRVGRYYDECVRDGDEWILQSRTMEEIFSLVENQ